MINIQTFSRYSFIVSILNAIVHLDELMYTPIYSSKLKKALDHYEQYFLKKAVGKEKEADLQAYLGMQMLNRVTYAILQISERPEAEKQRFDRELADLFTRNGIDTSEIEKLFEIDEEKDEEYRQKALEKAQNKQLTNQS